MSIGGTTLPPMGKILSKRDTFARKQKERMAKQKAPNARRAIVEE
jgi:hypothetical protein